MRFQRARQRGSTRGARAASGTPAFASGFLLAAFVGASAGGQLPAAPAAELPVEATRQLAASLAAAEAHPRHIWRDTPPLNTDGTVNAYIEIPTGDRRKWEFDMRANQRAIDRVVDAAVGGYPVNYGFVPQTVSYDGDPFDVLVLGPPLAGGQIVRGTIVGLLLMEDEKGHDAKVVVSPVGAGGDPPRRLTADERRVIAEYFSRYKRYEPGKFSRVHGWGSAADAGRFIDMTHAFFRQCRSVARGPCRLARANAAAPDRR
jgi:inorganic pyrophosphatase